MSGVGNRLLGFLINQDRAFNSLGGGHVDDTISGTIGRGLTRGYWWAKPARFVVDGIFGQGHCETQAIKEAKSDG